MGKQPDSLARMTGNRWGSDVPSGGAEARARLVDAAEACIERFGLSKTTLEDVARVAEVSRATVYRYVDNRDELMIAVLLRQLDQAIEQPLDEFLVDADTPEAFAVAVADMSAYLLTTIRTSPKLSQLLQQEGRGLSATIEGAATALFAEHADDMRPRLEAALERGLLRRDRSPDEIAEFVLRSVLSLLIVDGPVRRSPAEEREFLRSFLAPALLPVPVRHDA